MYHLHSGNHTQLNTVQQCILWIGSLKWQESDHSSSSHHCLRWRHSANDTSEPIHCKIRIKGIKMQKYGESKCKRCKPLLLGLLVKTQTKEKDEKTFKSENANKRRMKKRWKVKMQISSTFSNLQLVTCYQSMSISLKQIYNIYLLLKA